MRMRNYMVLYPIISCYRIYMKNISPPISHIQNMGVLTFKGVLAKYFGEDY